MAFRFHTGSSGVAGDFIVCDDASEIQNIWDGGGTSMGWIEIDSYGQAGFGRIVDKDGLSIHGWIWFVDDALDNFGFLIVFSGTNGQWRTPTNSIEINTRYHVAITYNSDSSANDPVFYIDGQSVAVTQVAGPTGSRTSDSGARLLLGQRFTYDRAFDGVIGDLRLYDRILTAGEIQTIFTANGGDNIITGLIRRFPMSPKQEALGINTSWRDDTEASILSTTIIVDVPTHDDGDLLVLVVNVGSNTTGTPANITTPSGWVQRIHLDFPSTATTPVLAVYTRIASSEPATYTVAHNQTSPMVGFMTAHPGIASATPDISATNTGTTASPVSPSVTPSANSLIVWVAGMDNSVQEPTIRGDFFPPEINGRRVLSLQGGGSNGVVTGVGEELYSGSATGTRTWSGAASDQWGAATLAWLYGDGIEGLPGKDVSENAEECQSWHQVIGAEDSLKIQG